MCLNINANNLDVPTDKKQRFVFIKEDLALPDINVRQYEVGYVCSEDMLDLQVYFIVGNRTIKVNKCLLEYFNPEETGDLFSKKVCNVCHRLLDTEMFDKNQNGKDNRPIRRPSCTECRHIIDGTPLKSKDRVEWNKVKPHLIPFECPICKKRTIAGLTSKVVLDHNHETGEARGWICDSCNTGIGRFKDNIELLESAISFVKKH
jgi:hypothetical protein